MSVTTKDVLRHHGGRWTVDSIAWFTIHQFIATYGISFAAPYVSASVFDLLRLFGKRYPADLLYSLLTGTPYFPVQIFLALLLGFFVSRHFKHRVMIWVWIIPLVFLLYALVAVPTFTPSLTPPDHQAGVGESRLSHYFGWGCQPVNRCIDQTIVTLPCYTALCYSLGALLARRIPKRFRRPNPRYFWVYLMVGCLFLTAFYSELRQLIDLLRRGGQWQWIYLQPLTIVAGSGALLILYSIVVARGKPLGVDKK